MRQISRLCLLHFFSAFSAQKSHVKPPNHLTPSIQRKSSWRISSNPTVILKIEIRKSPSANRQGPRI
jgi:hypothetical protein